MDDSNSEKSLSSEEAFVLLDEWQENSLLWLSCCSPFIDSIAAECGIENLSATEVTLGLGAKNGVRGLLVIPFETMEISYFANAANAPFKPPANDSMGECLMLKSPWPRKILIVLCVLKGRTPH